MPKYVIIFLICSSLAVSVSYLSGSGGSLDFSVKEFHLTVN
jgi:hypothetical protein